MYGKLVDKVGSTGKIENSTKLNYDAW